MYRILYLEKNREKVFQLQRVLPLGHRVEWIPDRYRLFSAMDEILPHAVVISFAHPKPEDFDVLKNIVGHRSRASVVVTCRGLTVSQAVCCMRIGAVDCLNEPAHPIHIAESLGRHRGRLCDGTSEVPEPFIGSSPAMERVYLQLQMYAKTNFPVLIFGESGTGKDLAAHAIHLQSSRREKDFIPINCAALPRDLLESELFGSVRGAFTGAVDRTGRFEQAHHGTLFLDEIGDMSLESQAALLRVLEDMKIQRLGSDKSRKVDVRIIAATNKNLNEEIENKRFRHDLYYRLQSFTVRMPPLRENTALIPTLAQHFLRKDCGHKPWVLEGSALKKLAEYPWPGNVRELRSVILRASVTAMGNKVRARDILFD